MATLRNHINVTGKRLAYCKYTERMRRMWEMKCILHGDDEWRKWCKQLKDSLAIYNETVSQLPQSLHCFYFRQIILPRSYTLFNYLFKWNKKYCNNLEWPLSTYRPVWGFATTLLQCGTNVAQNIRVRCSATTGEVANHLLEEPKLNFCNLV